ncbi:hypothetical protein GCM10008018_69350 [Paenibacillus marchantiophytorum]|uniref:PhnB-like domain-containing protein n=1 Tax=Paenibacillus marchantiophytorum TaxID=1619310 RepID=A0ABQ1FHQ7_9BACL|nr:hypothetical protein GCM10008018_69350 [Paenibacillus marchantiophytorum]
MSISLFFTRWRNSIFGDASEAETAYAKLSVGGESKYPLALQPWGAYYGEVVDKFGVTWMITKQ